MSCHLHEQFQKSFIICMESCVCIGIRTRIYYTTIAIERRKKCRYWKDWKKENKKKSVFHLYIHKNPTLRHIIIFHIFICSYCVNMCGLVYFFFHVVPIFIILFFYHYYFSVSCLYEKNENQNLVREHKISLWLHREHYQTRRRDARSMMMMTMIRKKKKVLWSHRKLLNTKKK